MTSLIPAPSCCRPHAPFDELVRASLTQASPTNCTRDPPPVWPAQKEFRHNSCREGPLADIGARLALMLLSANNKLMASGDYNSHAERSKYLAGVLPNDCRNIAMKALVL